MNLRIIFATLSMLAVLPNLSAVAENTKTPTTDSKPQITGKFLLKLSKDREISVPNIMAIAWSPDDAMFTTSSFVGIDDNSVRSGTLNLFDISGHKLSKESNYSGTVTDLKFVGTTQILVSHQLESPGQPSRLAYEVLNLKTSSSARVLGEPESMSMVDLATDPEFSADQKIVALANSKHQAVNIYDTADWHLLHTISAPNGVLFTAVAVFPGGKQLAIGTDNGNILITDTITGKTIKTIQVFDCTPPVRAAIDLSISPSGKFLSVGYSHTIFNEKESMFEGIAGIPADVLSPKVTAWEKAIPILQIRQVSDGKMLTSFASPDHKPDSMDWNYKWAPKEQFIAFTIRIGNNPFHYLPFLWKSDKGDSFTKVAFPGTDFSDPVVLDNLCIDSEGRYVAIATDDTANNNRSTLVVWETATGGIMKIPFADKILNLSVLSNGSTLAVAHGTDDAKSTDSGVTIFHIQ